MSSDPNVAFYERDEVVDEYRDRRAEGLFDRERRAIDTYFSPGSRVLDLGCGAGRTTQALDDRGFDTVGVDASHGMVAAAREAAPQGEYVTADAATLPFADGAFDNVLFSYNGLDELRPEAARYRALREIHRVLKPGGRFVFSTHNVLRQLIPYPVTRDHLVHRARFWWRNVRAGFVGLPYKLTRTDGPEKAVYHTDPLRQARQLTAVGFEVIALLERETLRSKYFGPTCFFVVEHPDESASGGS